MTADTQSDILSRPRREIGLKGLPYDIFEPITDNLTILDVKNLNATARIFYHYTQADWVRFLRRRLVRHCKGTRPLCFLIFLYKLEEAHKKGGNLASEEVIFQIDRLRNGLATESSPRGLSDSLQSLQDPEILRILCGYMDTIDEMTEDFHSQILFPKPTRKSVEDRVGLESWRDRRYCPPHRPVSPEIPFSDAERGRMQEGFLAYHILCVLAKSQHEDGRKYMDRLSSLEIERILSIQAYFNDTWRWLLIEPFQRPGWEEYMDCRIVRDGQIAQPGLISDFASGGITLLRLEFNAKREGRDRPVWFDKHWSSMVTSSLAGFRPYKTLSLVIRSAITQHAINCRWGQHKPGLSPGEEERHDAEVTPFWNDILRKKMERAAGGWYGRHWGENSNWILSELRDCGWVFLDKAKFEVVRKHWEYWRNHPEDRRSHLEDWRRHPKSWIF